MEVKLPCPLHIFLTHPTGKSDNPEVYPRPDGTVYICGYSDDAPLPEHADLVQPDQQSVKALENMSKHVSPNLKGRLNGSAIHVVLHIINSNFICNCRIFKH